MRLGTAVLVLAGWTSPAFCQAMVGAVSLPIGSRAPSFVLETIDGASFDLDSVVGHRPILLEFWAAWCENCEALAPQMEEAYQRYGDQVEFIAVAVGVGQSVRRVRRYVSDHGTPWLYLWDGRGVAVRTYEAPTTSVIVVIDRDGLVRYTGVGREQDIQSALGTVLTQ